MSSKASARKKSKGENQSASDVITIDEQKGWVFPTEDALFTHFEKDIKALEQRFFDLRTDKDIPIEQFEHFEEYLGAVLEDPDQILEDTGLIAGQTTYVYWSKYEDEKFGVFYYLAITYVTGDTPSFIYLHFPSSDEDLVREFTKGAVVYDRLMKEVQRGAAEGDALSEGDELAVGLYTSMLKVRTDKDIAEDDFKSYIQFREETIEEPDEIWRSSDFAGNVLVTFVREYEDLEGVEGPVFYIVVTVEDEPSGSHALLFSFPTTDANLVERYRRGENLQAEEVVQEASH
jgi:hypothetical protein